jgi:glycosyltransferase involved in cell wall biosynthesis
LSEVEAQPPRVSVLTPTYQRAATLPRLYESLVAQTTRDFEWVVVDDGSTDGSEDLMRSWQAVAEFPIDYSRQPNRGKHAAVNAAVLRARGELCAVMDSDDWYAPEALERMLAQWDAIPAGRRGEFASVEGLCADPAGEVIGDRYPADVFDSNAFEIWALHGVTGDKVGMYRRDLLAAHPFPEDLGWHVRPAVVWNRIAARYSSRFVNEVWGYKEYLSEGLTALGGELRLKLPEAQLLFWSEFAAMPRPMRTGVRLRANANFVRYSLLAGRGVRRLLADAPDRRWLAIAWLPGLALYLRDRRRLSRAAAPEARAAEKPT